MADFLCRPLFYRQEVVSLCRQSVQIMQKIPKPMGINLFEAKPTVETIAKVGNPFEQFGSLVGFEMPPVKGGISKMNWLKGCSIIPGVNMTFPELIIV